VLAKNDVDLGDALCPEVEGFTLLFGHAKENFVQASIGLLLRQGCEFITQVFELLCIEPALLFHEPFLQAKIRRR
jgi:hypothetical protein